MRAASEFQSIGKTLLTIHHKPLTMHARCIGGRRGVGAIHVLTRARLAVGCAVSAQNKMNFGFTPLRTADSTLFYWLPGFQIRSPAVTLPRSTSGVSRDIGSGKLGTCSALEFVRCFGTGDLAAMLLGVEGLRVSRRFFFPCFNASTVQLFTSPKVKMSNLRREPNSYLRTGNQGGGLSDILA